jgi:GNAT acetyltransferase-like protein
MLEFRLLAAEEIPWARLDTLADRTVFQTREWLNFIAETQSGTPVVAELRDGPRPVGYFSGVVIRKFGVKMLGSSFPGWATPYIGFNLLPDSVTRNEALHALRRWAFGGLGCLHFEVSDWYFRNESIDTSGLDATAYESYESDLTQTEDELFGRMDSSCRRCIRKAEKSGLTIEHATDAGFVDEYYEQLKDVFAKQGKFPTYDVGRVRSLVRHLQPTGNILLVRARNPEGRSIATGIYPGLNEVAYFWGNASWRSDQQWRPNESLHWYAMRYWKQRGVKSFDWGGGGAYKEKYGVHPLSVPWFYKSKYRIMTVARNEARDLYYRSRKLIGRLRGVADPAKSQQPGL